MVVSWNTWELLRRCLTSIERERRRSGLSLEVIVIDNGSTDGSAERLAAQRPEPLLISNPDNRGFSAANNQGIARAGGLYVLLLNPDTELEPGSLRALLDYAGSHPRVGVLGPKLLNPDGSLQPSGGRLPRLGSTLGELFGLDRLTGRQRYGTRRDFSVPAVVEEVSGAAMLVRAEVIEQVGGLDEGFAWGYEDVDFCKRAGAAGWEVHYVPSARVRHEWGASRRVAPAATVLKAVNGRRHYFQKHFGAAAAAVVMAATVVSHLLRALAFAVTGGRGRAVEEWQIFSRLLGRS